MVNIMKPETLAKNQQRLSVRLTLSSVGPAALGERRRMLKLKPGQAVADRTEAAIFGATNQNQLTWPMEWVGMRISRNVRRVVLRRGGEAWKFQNSELELKVELGTEGRKETKKMFLIWG